jgi:glycerol-1-phosphate dehydrogenase [NAD(P)+]
MLIPKQTAIPALVRVKPGALDRMGIYAERHKFKRVLLFFSQDLDQKLLARLLTSFRSQNIQILQQTPVEFISFEKATELFRQSPRNADAIVGFGGGKALDVAKYIAFLFRLPYLSVPTSLSNDGFCSPQSSLTVGGRRHTLPSAVPFGVILDTAVCLGAPEISGIPGSVTSFRNSLR